MRRHSPEYKELFQKALERSSVTVPLATPTEARNLRSYLYHYRSWLKETDPEFYDQVQGLKFYVHPRALEIAIPSAPGAEEIQRALEK